MRTFVIVYLARVLSGLHCVHGARVAVSKEGATGEWYWSSMNVAFMAFT